ncbi:MAG: helix-turn-helix transcriptional regulator [Oscillospiraceae bacterium]|nr:helix-turn-helix transcriptional regulator [Oscillospiraceae bacterium]
MKEKTWLPGKISDRVRDLREEWGLTRKELAQRSGVDESLLGRIENNKIRKIQDDALTKLAKFLSAIIEQDRQTAYSPHRMA